MSALGWAIVLALPAYAAIQLVFLVVVGRRFAFGEGEAPPHPLLREGAASADAVRPAAIPSVVCPACGSENDPGYRYCGSCVARLTAG